MSVLMYAASASSFGSLSSVDLGSRVSVAVARKTLDAAEAQGAAAVEMIKEAGEVGRKALKVTPRPDLSTFERGPISATPVSGEPGRVLDVTG